MAVLFISDLHLSSSRPGISQVFFQFLRGRAVQAPDLYILGDLFEYWAGDDDIGDPFNAKVVAALAECARGGTRILQGDRKSTRLNSSHANISYAVFCLKKKNSINR